MNAVHPINVNNVTAPSDLPPSYGSIFEENDPLAHFRRHVRNKTCYSADAIDRATVTTLNDRVAFQTEIWSLMEKRSVLWEEKPYNNEPENAKEIGNLFKDHVFTTPPTIIEGKQTDSRNLTDCQRSCQCDTCRGSGKYHCSTCRGQTRIDCLNCNHRGYYKSGKVCQQCHGQGTLRCSMCIGTGYKNCDRCNAKGKILKWPILTVEWYTQHSVKFSQNTFLPEKLIPMAGAKTCFFTYDQPWSHAPNISAFPGLTEKIRNETTFDFEADVKKQYEEHHVNQTRHDTIIVRIKCTIDRVDIREISYSSPKYVNTTDPSKGVHVFTVLQYGRDPYGLPQFYENDYPLACCGCFGPTLANRSHMCTLS